MLHQKIKKIIGEKYGELFDYQKISFKHISNGKDILIIAEEHTRNTWYLENIRILQQMITRAGFNAKIARTIKERNAVATVSGYYLQVGAFSKLSGAKNTKRKFELILDKRYKVIIKQGRYKNKTINRLWISGFRSEFEANDFKKENGLKNAMLIAK